MKLFLVNLLVLIGLSKVYAGTSESFLKIVPRLEAVDGGAEGCSGCRECGGTERPTGGSGSK